MLVKVCYYFSIKMYFFRDAKATNDSVEKSAIPAGADLENLRNVFFQKNPVSYELCSTPGYDIGSELLQVQNFIS